MITQIRRHFKSPAYKSFLWFIILTFVLAFTLPMFFRRTAMQGPWAFRIDGKEISYQDFMREAAEKREQIAALRAQYGQYADFFMQAMGLGDPQRMAFDSLVRKELFNSVSDDMGLFLHEDYVTQKINDPVFVSQELSSLIPLFAFDKSGVLNQKILKEYVRAKGMTLSQFEQKVDQALLRHIIMEILSSGLYVPGFEVRQQYSARYVPKKYAYLKFSFDQALEKEKTKDLTEENVKNFYNQQNQKLRRYWVPEKRAGQFWKFDPSAYGIVVTDEQAEQYYKRNKTKKYVKTPIQVQIRRVSFELKDEINRDRVRTLAQDVRDELVNKPKEFNDLVAKVAKEHPFVKDLGTTKFFSRGDDVVSPQVERQAFLLQSNLDVSPVIQTSEGYEIIQRVEKKAPVFQSFNAVLNDIKKELTLRKFKTKFSQDVKQIQQQLSSNPQALLDFARDKNATKTSISLTTRDPNNDEVQALFNIQREGTISNYVDENIGYVVQLKKVDKPYLPTLDSIKKTVKDDLYQFRAERAVQAAVDKAYKDAQDQPLDKVASSFNAQVQNTGWVEGEDAPEIENLQKQGFPTSQMLQLEKVGAITGAKGTNQDGYLIKLVAQKPFDASVFEQKKPEIERELYEQQMRLFVEGFIASLYRNATIKTNESILAQQG